MGGRAGRPGPPASVVDVTANVLLFLPWGALLAIGLGGRRIGLIASTAAATALGAALSARSRWRSCSCRSGTPPRSTC